LSQEPIVLNSFDSTTQPISALYLSTEKQCPMDLKNYYFTFTRYRKKYCWRV